MYNITNIVEYVRSGRILENIEANNWFDIVIFETRKYIEKDFLEKKYNFDILFLEDVAFDFGISGIVKWLIDTKKKWLVILDKFNSFYLLPLLNILKDFQNRKVFILNLNVWITSRIFKMEPDYNDVWLFLDYWINIWEPMDLLKLFEIFEKNEIWYIRISNKDYALNVFEWWERQKVNSILNFSEYGISWINWTILAFGYMIPHVLQAMDSLNSEWLFFDLFWVLNYNFNFSQEIVDSISNTEKLIVIADTNSKNFENLLKAKLYDLNMPEVVLKIIKPEYNKIQTNQIDYIFEQAWFDYISLVRKIKKVVES